MRVEDQDQADRDRREVGRTAGKHRACIFGLQGAGLGLCAWCSPGSAQGGIMKEFVIKGRLTLERVTFHVSAETLEGALARAANGDFDGYDTDAAEGVDWHMALASIEENS
jgi:hypothetical protein